jgi:hypothetical protein
MRIRALLPGPAFAIFRDEVEQAVTLARPQKEVTKPFTLPLHYLLRKGYQPAS